MSMTMNPSSVVLDQTTSDVEIEGMAQVVLYNDDVNSFDHVVRCLVEIFIHSVQLASKLAWEAHKLGKTIAQVEGLDAAVLHKEQLQSFGLTVDVERI